MPPAALEPLFAHNAQAWLRAWVGAQGVALSIATLVALDGNGVGARGTTPGAIAAFAAVVAALHALGYARYRAILQRRWRVIVYCGLCWSTLLFGLRLHGLYSIMIPGAVLQGFLFLPFAWAAVTLTLLGSGLVALTVRAARDQGLPAMLTRVATSLTATLLPGAIMLYIHRANREAALRRDLLQQLEAAHRDLAARAREAGVLAERQRLSRDLHDTLAQGFASVVRQLEAVQLALPDGAALDDAHRTRILTHLGHAQEVSRASLTEIRRLVLSLRPTELANAPIVEALERVVAQWGSAHGVATTFTADEMPALQGDAEVTLLRVTQEALSNVARHARAAAVRVALSCVDELVMLAIEDDGRGFVPSDDGDGEHLGLRGMRDRARRLGGYVLVDSAPGDGVSVTLALPLSVVGESPRVEPT
ncbi:MAG: sensor histidine kinase [Gemmatimonadaceae bacterium]|nr:sensor histidine kinase [Gemmatimonadaceae bacterium]